MITDRFISTALLAISLTTASPVWAQDGGGDEVVETDSIDATSSRISRPGRATWDALFAGIPRGNMFHGELGFSGLPRLALHHAFGADLSVGGMFSFDYAYYLPNAAVTPSIALQAPIRLRVYESGQLSVGLRFEPGIDLVFANDFTFGLLLNAGVNLGYAVNNQIVVGGGLDMPIGIFINNNTFLAWPVLVGPMFEMHVTPALALTADLKLGPWISTNGSNFGLKFLVGAAFRL